MRISHFYGVLAASSSVLAAGPLRRGKQSSTFYQNITTSNSAPSDTSIEIIPLTSSITTETSGSVVLTISTLVPVLPSSSTLSSSVSTSLSNFPTSTESGAATTSILVSTTSSTTGSTSFSRTFTLQSTDFITIPSINTSTKSVITETLTETLPLATSASIVTDPIPTTSTISSSNTTARSTLITTTTTPPTNTNPIEIPTVLTSPPTSTTSLSPSLFAQNLAQAQSYNSLFLTLNASSPCTPNQVACLPVPNAALSNTTGIGICNTEDKYVITECPNSESKEFGSVSTGCFAVPLQGAVGVQVECVEVGAAGVILGVSATRASSTSFATLTSVSSSATVTTSSVSSASVTVTSSSVVPSSAITKTSETSVASLPPSIFSSTPSLESTSSETLNSVLTFSYTNPPASSNSPSTAAPSTTASSQSTTTLASGETIITIVPITIGASNQPVTVTVTASVTVTVS